MNNKSVILIGYSGHGFVVADSLIASGWNIVGYCDAREKQENPFKLNYLGKESDKSALEHLKAFGCFISIGDNRIRKRLYDFVINKGNIRLVNVIHPSSVVSNYSTIKDAILIAPNATINALSIIGKGAICNTACVIEHECKIGDFVHIAPGATLAGNVTVGEKSFIGANAVVKQGVKIGKNVTVGAGCVVVKNIPDNLTVIGNPARILRKEIKLV